LDLGSWILDLGSWILDLGRWALGVGRWALGVGLCLMLLFNSLNKFVKLPSENLGFIVKAFENFTFFQ
ncbi:MAG: hypothetical protein P1U86_21385, partial [Verrucomicrobiales bacterium]|nr:hypothetical protein [Verrucomicrobiales bacterium]